MRKVCLSGFRLMALFCCSVTPPFAVYDSLNQDERQRVTSAPKDSGGNTSNLTKHVTVHHSRNYQNVMINFHRR